MNRWNLNALYLGFDDPTFLDDFEQVPVKIKSISQWSPIPSDPAGSILSYLMLQEPLLMMLDRLQHFCELTFTADTNHPKAQKFQTRLEELQADMAIPETRFHAFIGSLENREAVLSGSSFLEERHFFLKELSDTARFLLDTQTEDLIARLASTGSSSWELLHSQITSDLMVDVPFADGVRSLPLAEVRNLASHPLSEIREAAFRAELAAYPQIASQAALALNSIKGEVLMLGKLRGYESPLQESLIHSRMKRETLDVMMNCLKEHLPILESMYLKKAQMLGHNEGLPFWDLFAPVGKTDRTYTIPEAQERIQTCFRAFSPDLADFAGKAFENSWIDWSARKGKVGGAFCSYAHSIEESRILMNFTGTFDDLTTLAHELGHGYHDDQLHGLPIHSVQYPMPLAETASIFCETLLAQELIRTGTPEERLNILEMRLQMIGQVLTDIYSRYLFETAVFEQRETFTLQADELCALMLDCQEKAYGKALNPNHRHPYMWVCKPHYYSAGFSFYNFPYAFGLLFATGLYAIFKEEGAAFVPKYRALLHQTGCHSIEDAALLAGIRLDTPEFWNGAFGLLKEEINQFMAL